MAGIDCRLIIMIFVSIIALSFAHPALADCSTPAGVEADQIYNTTYDVMQFCNGADWVNMGAAGGAAAETDPQVGALTASKWCKVNAGGTEIVCDQDAAAETDPQVGTLTNTKWCRTDGTQVICDQDAPPGTANCSAATLSFISVRSPSAYGFALSTANVPCPAANHGTPVHCSNASWRGGYALCFNGVLRPTSPVFSTETE